jgi:chromosome segregation protein
VSTARLRELRMVGFKSFAERTVVQLGPGISAVVGPNGSGKSNLADALRWALGEQGRALRSRRAEDLIFAGSANRRAVGMADVSLVIDNGDRLLSVDYEEVELSRRLFRSGENEYLLNRQRVRLRDLVDLLDDANIADNAFLFIGQGMVDQALALRPEERRPLFEEAAGIRKHQRRRGKAESELTEASANLERVRDLLGELRPQARRLAAQAEQQEARAVAGSELAAALVEAARARLTEAEATSMRHAEALAMARREGDAAMADLRQAEEAAASLTRGLADRADGELLLRRRVDEARAVVQAIELARARAESEAAAVARERARISEERGTITSRAEASRQDLAALLPEADTAVEDALAEAERRLVEATREVEDLRAAGRADFERLAGLRAARDRAVAEAEEAARRASEAERRSAEQQQRTDAAAAAVAEAAARASSAAEGRRAAHEAEAEAETEAAAARQALGEADAAAAASREAVARDGAETAALEAREAALAAQLADSLDDELLRDVHARGGRRLADGLEVEPALRIAVEAALSEAMTGVVVDAGDAVDLGEAAAVLVLRERVAEASGDRARDRAAERTLAALEEGIAQAGGGRLASALRLDSDGDATRLLARSAWVPDLASALALRRQLPPGWRLVTRTGIVVDDLGVVRPAPATSRLERRASHGDVVGRLASANAALASSRTAADAAAAGLREAEGRVTTARIALDEARRQRRVMDETDRAAAASAQNAVREHAWQEALRDRAATEAGLARDEAERRAEELQRLRAGQGDESTADGGALDDDLLAGLQERLGSLRDVRDRAAASALAARAEREHALEVRRRAEVSLGIAEARLEELDREEVALSGRDADIASGRERHAAEGTAAEAKLAAASAAFEASVADARAERERLLAAEAAAVEARERLRLAESRSRASEVAEMEARVQVDAAREGLLVELATIGPDGLAILLGHGALPAPTSVPSAEELPDQLEVALEAALQAWRDEAAAAMPADAPGTTGNIGGGVGSAAEPPSRLRIAALRRRFNDVGASNPYAAQELAEVQVRLDSLEAQREDLEKAIRETRELMARLDQLMTEQFRATFGALEGAFARRFQQLFGGGEAQLSLTDPEDLTATGVEITARPPGKRRQPLAMLSGGERALTAVALLLAMLEVRPVPFCVLDEVDAALDEANIGRFSSALRSLAREIQFIVITHNRGTIEAADALYGVTVGDDAVSRVLSLKLADLPEEAAVGSAT